MLEFLSLELGWLTSCLALRPELLAPNRYLHAAHNFTDIELKSNFLNAIMHCTSAIFI